MKINKDRLNAQMYSPAYAIPVHELPEGTTLELVEVLENTGPDGEPMDILMFKSDLGQTVAIKLTTMLRIHDATDFISIDGDDAFLAPKVRIIAKHDRMTRHGERIYPIQCYNGWETVLEAGQPLDDPLLMENLMARGLRTDIDCIPKQVVTFESFWS